MLKKRDTRVQCSLEGNGSSLRFRVRLAKGEKDGKAYLEVRTVLRRHGSPWTRCFDGASVRSILRPFRPFAFDGLFLALPMAAAWNRSGGAALALAPESLCGWISRGMPEENAVGLTLRTVLRKEGEITFDFDLLSFDSVYGADDAVDRYHALHPAFFRLNPGINPDNYGNLAIQNVWKNAAYLSRAPHFSLRELTRRTRGSWAWFYYSGSSPGNWAADPELLNELAPVNLRHLGDGYFHEGHTRKVAAECAALKKNAVSSALYVSSWADRRFTRYFSDSLFESADTYNGITSWPQYWGRNAFDHIMLAWGTSYGKHLLRQCAGLLKNNPDCDTFAFDLCGYDYQFRKTNSLGGLNAFDEHGEYLPQVTALAELLDAMRRLENAAGSQTAVVANADVSLAGFPTAFRVANTLHEQQRILTLQSVQQRRRQTRLMGERPTTFYCMPPLTGNYFTDEDPRLLRYAAVSEHQNHLLKGMLYNIRQNWEIFGVKESVEALDELLRTQSLGHRQTVGAKIEGRLEAVRYGEPHRGAIALVNSSPETQSATVTLDTAYYHAVPLVAAEGVRLDVENGVFQTDGIKPLSWRVVEFAGALPHPCAPRYSSTLSRTPDLTEISLTFKHPVLLKGMRIECRAGETLMLRLNGREISQIPDNAAAGDTLVIGFRNPIWLAPAREIISIPAEKETCIRLSGTGDGAENEIGRIAEFFRYHALMTGGKIRIEPHAQPDEAHIQVIAADAPAGIGLRNGRVVLQGKRRFLPRLTGEYLKALEARYPLYGVFGTQQPTRPLDWTATPMQARFQKRHDLIGKTVSTQETASEFIRFLKEKGIQETQGF